MFWPNRPMSNMPELFSAILEYKQSAMQDNCPVYRKCHGSGSGLSGWRIQTQETLEFTDLMEETLRPDRAATASP
jgi:hypothetical protein